jgi:hypothetical protein
VVSLWKCNDPKARLTAMFHPVASLIFSLCLDRSVHYWSCSRCIYIRAKNCFPGPWAYPQWEIILTHQNYGYEETIRRLKSVDTGHNLIQNLLSFCMLSKNIMTGYTKLMFCPVVFHGCEAWSLTLREEHRLCLQMRSLGKCWRGSHRRLEKIRARWYVLPAEYMTIIAGLILHKTEKRNVWRV